MHLRNSLGCPNSKQCKQHPHKRQHDIVIVSTPTQTYSSKIKLIQSFANEINKNIGNLKALAAQTFIMGAQDPREIHIHTPGRHRSNKCAFVR